MKMVTFHLFRHFRLHFDFCLEEVLKQLELLTFAVKGHSVGVDRANGELLGCWAILHARQDLS